MPILMGVSAVSFWGKGRRVLPAWEVRSSDLAKVRCLALVPCVDGVSHESGYSGALWFRKVVELFGCDSGEGPNVGFFLGEMPPEDPLGADAKKIADLQ